jgi:hypothetical protein
LIDVRRIGITYDHDPPNRFQRTTDWRIFLAALAGRPTAALRGAILLPHRRRSSAGHGEGDHPPIAGGAGRHSASA